MRKILTRGIRMQKSQQTRANNFHGFSQSYAVPKSNLQPRKEI